VSDIGNGRADVPSSETTSAFASSKASGRCSACQEVGELAIARSTSEVRSSIF
jgi:hypothetical protein